MHYCRHCLDGVDCDLCFDHIFFDWHQFYIVL
jgi:hypothetical protein